MTLGAAVIVQRTVARSLYLTKDIGLFVLSPAQQEVLADADYSLSLADLFYDYDKSHNIFQVPLAQDLFFIKRKK